MKICPYCAEKIQDAAIVCRYCGRDLPQNGDEKTPPVQKSIWKKAAIASLVMAVAYAIEQIINPTNELFFRLTIGLAVTFLSWWLIWAGIFGTWRRFGASIAIGIYVVVGALVLILALVAGGNLGATLAPVPTPTLTPHPTSTPSSTSPHIPKTPTLSPVPSWLGTCTPASSLGELKEGALVCVYGSISPSILAGMQELFFDAARGRVIVKTGEAEMVFRPFDGDCVIAIGQIVSPWGGGLPLAVPELHATNVYRCNGPP